MALSKTRLGAAIKARVTPGVQAGLDTVYPLADLDPSLHVQATADRAKLAQAIAEGISQAIADEVIDEITQYGEVDGNGDIT